MIYEYISILKPYIIEFLIQQKQIVSKFCYKHRCAILQNFDHFVSTYDYKNLNFTEEQLFHWMETLKGKPTTLNSYVSTLRTFFKFLTGYGFHPFMPPYYKENNDYIAYEFSDNEIDRIISCADNYVLCPNPQSIDKPHPNRKYVYIQYELPMILRILLGCGLRLEEASTLKLKDINFTTDTLTIRKTKSNEYRIVPMDSSLSKILAKYCNSMKLGVNSEA